MTNKAALKRTVVYVLIALLFGSILGVKSWLFGDGYESGLYKGFFLVYFVIIGYYLIKVIIRKLKEKTYYEIEDNEW
jgi:uncharacterized membrane protein YfcA